MLEPLGHRVIVECSIEEKSQGGVILARDERLAKASTEHGILVAIGPEAWKAHNRSSGTTEPWAKVGDKVIFSKYGGKVVEEDPIAQKDPKKYYMVMNDDDVLCRINGE